MVSSLVSRLGGLLFTLILGTTTFLVGCGGEEVQTEESKQITQQKTQEMEKAMREAMQKQGRGQ